MGSIHSPPSKCFNWIIVTTEWNIPKPQVPQFSNATKNKPQQLLVSIHQQFYGGAHADAFTSQVSSLLSVGSKAKNVVNSIKFTLPLPLRSMVEKIMLKSLSLRLPKPFLLICCFGSDLEIFPLHSVKRMLPLGWGHLSFHHWYAWRSWSLWKLLSSAAPVFSLGSYW